MSEATVYYSTEDKSCLCFKHAVLVALYQGKKVQTNCSVSIGTIPGLLDWDISDCVDCEKEKQAMKELGERRSGKD